MEMLSASKDPEPFVTTSEYAAEQKRRAQQGERHPSDSTLRANYGHWLKVISAASRFMRIGGAARIMNAPARQGPSQSYRPDEIASALLRCHHDLGDWPTEWEYTEWAVLKRSMASSNPRLPSPKVIRKAYGSFADALDTTRANYQASQHLTGPHDV
jgi:hypothetical protein